MFGRAREKSRSARGVSPLRFVRAQDGAAAIEFGLVAAPFLALAFAIMETAMVFFAGQTLETATADSARLIMTGQAQTQGMSQSQFKPAVCSKIFGLFDCSAGVKVDVHTYSSFNSADMTKPIDANGNLDQLPVSAGRARRHRRRAARCIQWPVYISLLGLNLADMAGNKRLIVATAAFRNEPYQ